MVQNQVTIVNNTIEFGKKATPYVGLYFIGRLIMDALNNSGHDFAQIKLKDSVKAIHNQKLAWAFCVIILFLISLFKK